MSKFIDLCILLGCDYLEPIRGVGPKSALKLIREHGGLAGVVEHLREKYVISTLRNFVSLTRGLYSGRQRRRRKLPTQKMAPRRKREAYKSPKSGPGKRQRNYSKNQM